MCAFFQSKRAVCMPLDRKYKNSHSAKAARNTIIAETLDMDAGIAADAAERICYQTRMYA